MSGIEVAGLVLGAIPVLITALELYSKGARLDALWKIQFALDPIRRELRAELQIYKNTCEELLQSIAPHKIKELVEDPGGKAWQDQDLDDAMKSLLGTSYEVFFETIEIMNENVVKFKKKLCLGADGKVFDQNIWYCVYR